MADRKRHCVAVTVTVSGQEVRLVNGHAEIPSSITAISNGAFSNCTSLSSVTIPDEAEIDTHTFDTTTTVTRLPPARMLAQQRLLFLFRGVLAYKRSRAALFAWLERSQTRIGAYAAGGVGRKRDREAFEEEFNGGS